jgi:hypothetical protein
MLSTVLAGGPRRAAQPPRTPVHRRAVALMQQQEQDFRVDVRRTASEMKQLLHDSENACNTVELAISTEQLERILMHQLYAPAGSRPKYVFFDVDECLVMPATPFIDGLPGSDALVRKLVLCGETVHAALRRKMIEAYYSAPLTLVDAGTTAPAPRPSTSADSPSSGLRLHAARGRTTPCRRRPLPTRGRPAPAHRRPARPRRERARPDEPRLEQLAFPLRLAQRASGRGAGGKGPRPCLRIAPHRLAWWLPRLRPPRRTPERRLRAACTRVVASGARLSLLPRRGACHFAPARWRRSSGTASASRRWPTSSAASTATTPRRAASCTPAASR